MAANPNTLTVPAPPTTVDAAARVLAFMAAQTGVLTDLLPGSIIRTWAESQGSAVSITAIELQAAAYQAILFGGYSAFNVVPLLASPATGNVTFSTASGASGPTSVVNVDIPPGTIVQTAGGIQFQTLVDTTLAVGSSAVTANVQAVIPGAGGNVVSGSITQIVTPIQALLYVNNPNATIGGINAETTQQTASRFANIIAALQLSSPQAVASSVIGVANGSEQVLYSTCYEPWLTQGAGPYTVGYTVYIDNGSGAASNTLITNATNKLNGDLVNFTTSGFRPAGVPFGVSAVGPVYANVIVTATHVGNANPSLIAQQITTAIQGYFSTLNFGATALASFLSTQVANSVINSISSLTVQLSAAAGASVSAVTAAATSRVILLNPTVTVN